MKKRTITLMLSILAVAMLVGVGFATWVISQGAGTEIPGSVVVEAVSDERLGVTVALDATHETVEATKGKFVFGHPATVDPNAWLHTKGEDPQEKLEVYYVVTVTKQGGVAFTNDEKTGILVIGTLAEVANANNLVGSSSALINLGAGVTEVKGENDASTRVLSDDNKTLTVYMKATVNWGSLFGGLNPYAYFNGTIGEGQNVVAITSKTEIGSSIATALVNAGIKHPYATSGEPAKPRDFIATDNYGDFALAALNAIYAKNAAQFKVTFAISYPTVQ